MNNIFVAGSGLMGSGIAQVCAQAGCTVSIMDIDDNMLQKAMKTIQWSLNKLEEKKKIKETAEAVLSRIKPVTSLEAACDADLMIEAIIEDLDTKQTLFKSLDAICPPETVFGTNTSAIPIIEIASAVKDPGRVVGIHFFNPVHRMKLVEVIKSLATSDETIDKARQFAIAIGKEPVVVNRDTAGFIVNRINGMAFLEALKLLEKGVAGVEDIDKAMRLGLGNAMGPFELMDMVGLDVVLNARMGVYNETRDPCHYPPGILKSMVKAGFLGRKTGKGFYEYT